MNITQKTQTFAPEVIEITSQQELDDFVEVIRGCYWNCGEEREASAGK